MKKILISFVVTLLASSLVMPSASALTDEELQIIDNHFCSFSDICDVEPVVPTPEPESSSDDCEHESTLNPNDITYPNNGAVDFGNYNIDASELINALSENPDDPDAFADWMQEELNNTLNEGGSFYGIPEVDAMYQMLAEEGFTDEAMARADEMMQDLDPSTMIIPNLNDINLPGIDYNYGDPSPEYDRLTDNEIFSGSDDPIQDYYDQLCETNMYGCGEDQGFYLDDSGYLDYNDDYLLDGGLGIFGQTDLNNAITGSIMTDAERDYEYFYGDDEEFKMQYEEDWIEWLCYGETDCAFQMNDRAEVEEDHTCDNEVYEFNEEEFGESLLEDEEYLDLEESEVIEELEALEDVEGEEVFQEILDELPEFEIDYTDYKPSDPNIPMQVDPEKDYLPNYEGLNVNNNEVFNTESALPRYDLDVTELLNAYSNPLALTHTGQNIEGIDTYSDSNFDYNVGDVFVFGTSPNEFHLMNSMDMGDDVVLVNLGGEIFLNDAYYPVMTAWSTDRFLANDRAHDMDNAYFLPSGLDPAEGFVENVIDFFYRTKWENEIYAAGNSAMDDERVFIRNNASVDSNLSQINSLAENQRLQYGSNPVGDIRDSIVRDLTTIVNANIESIDIDLRDLDGDTNVPHSLELSLECGKGVCRNKSIVLEYALEKAGIDADYVNAPGHAFLVIYDENGDIDYYLDPMQANNFVKIPSRNIDPRQINRFSYGF